MKKSLSIVLFMLTLSVFAQLRANNTESYYSMKGTFNSDKKDIIKKTIEKEFGEGTLEDSGYIWTGRGSFEIILNDNSLKMEIQKSTDNGEVVDKIKNLGDKILATKNINNTNT
ncbi:MULTISPECIES: hypothetical protein [unclassified Empedobacter]|uniref:hypothetical protein n=1 Tax=unclassified Empedobacter TaxID=2643773 RepID=UPI0025B95CB6|nr:MULTISPECIES: hypothetical protein [unclassified Empedobacter]